MKLTRKQKQLLGEFMGYTCKLGRIGWGGHNIYNKSGKPIGFGGSKITAWDNIFRKFDWTVLMVFVEKIEAMKWDNGSELAERTKLFSWSDKPFWFRIEAQTAQIYIDRKDNYIGFSYFSENDKFKSTLAAVIQFIEWWNRNNGGEV